MDLAFTHGVSGAALAYATVQAPMLVGLARGRAPLREYLGSPLVAGTLAGLSALGMAAAAPLLGPLGATSHGVFNLALGSAVSMTLGYLGGVVAAERGTPLADHQRGALVLEEPPQRAKKLVPAPTHEITVAGTAIPMADETKHFKMIGTTGTGKSTAIQEILYAAFARGDRAIIADPDGGYLKRFYDPARRDVVLNPFEQNSVKWDLFGEIQQPYDVEQLARSLIPDADGSDTAWSAYARTFFTAVTRQAHQSGITNPGELYRLLVVADAAEVRALVKGTPAQPFLDEHNSRMFDSIRSVTSSAVGALDYVAQQKGPRFSVREWVNSDSGGSLFIPYKAGQIAALRSTISAWMRLGIFEAMNRDEQPDERDAANPRRLWFVVDELDALGKIDGLKDALARLRKFGGRCVLGFQSISQVSSTYGQGDAHTIVENCGNTLILRCSSSEGGGTAKFASQLIGDREILRATESRSHADLELLGRSSRSEHYSVGPAVMPSQIEQLPDLAGYLKRASQPDWQRVRLDAVRRWNQQRADARAPRDAGARTEPRWEHGHG